MADALRTLLHPRDPDDWIALAVRVVAGAIFVGFSLGKFLRHGAEAAAFDRYGVPFPDASTYLIGSLEAICGCLLIVGFLTRPAAFTMACNMAVAISTAGRIEGGVIHLGLAPMLLIAMIYLVWSGAGRTSIDQRLTRVIPARYPS